jgi:hypothetical protein
VSWIATALALPGALVVLAMPLLLLVGCVLCVFNVVAFGWHLARLPLDLARYRWYWTLRRWF